MGIGRMKAVDDVPAVRAWRMKRDWCAACGRAFNEFHNPTVHHIIGGRGGRSDEPCNLLALCWEPCHMLAEGLDIPDPRDKFNVLVSSGESRSRLLPKITLAVAIAMKARSDPDEVDLDRLAELNGKPLPDATEIPAFFNALFLHNRPEFR